MHRALERTAPRRLIALALLALTGLTVAAALPSAADARELRTLVVPSQNIVPAEEPFGPPPADGPPRPKALRVNVLLPDGYSAANRHRYPVLYLLHGAGQAFDHWAHPARGNAKAILDAAGFPGIVVMPDGGAIGFYSDWWRGGARSKPKFESYFLNELVPFIEQNFAIRAGRRSHAIAGLSMGGFGALYLASQRPDYFGSAASFSGVPSIERDSFRQVFDAFFIRPYSRTFDDILGPSDGFYYQGHNPLRLVDNLRNTRLYVTSGDGQYCPGDSSGSDFEGFGPDAAAPAQKPFVTPAAVAALGPAEAELRSQADEFNPAARAAGADVTERRTCGVHWWDVWRRALADALAWNPLNGNDATPARWKFRTAAAAGTAWDLGFRFDAPPAAITTFTRDGAALQAAGAGTVTLAKAGATCRAALPFTRRLPSGLEGLRRDCSALSVRAGVGRAVRARNGRASVNCLSGNDRLRSCAVRVFVRLRRAGRVTTRTVATGSVRLSRGPKRVVVLRLTPYGRRQAAIRPRGGLAVRVLFTLKDADGVAARAERASRVFGS